MGVSYVLKYYYEQVSTIPSVFRRLVFLKDKQMHWKGGHITVVNNEYRAARPCGSKISSRFFSGQILPPPLYLYLFFYHTGCTVFLNVLTPKCFNAYMQSEPPSHLLLPRHPTTNSQHRVAHVIILPSRPWCGDALRQIMSRVPSSVNTVQLLSITASWQPSARPDMMTA